MPTTDLKSPTPSSDRDSNKPKSRPPLKSREEIHFLLFLRRTEEHCSEFASKGEITNQKVVYFVKNLRELVDQLEQHPQAPSSDDLREYRSRVNFLQKVIDSLTPPPDPIPRLGIDVPFLGLTKDEPLQIYGVTTSINEESEGDLTSVIPELRNAQFNRLAPLPKAVGNENVKAKEIRIKHMQKNLMDDRSELFGESDTELRHRKVGQIDSELDDLMKAHHHAQEQVAEEMLQLVRSLKDQSLAAGEIIRKDTKTLEKSNQMADQNASKLATESERLQKHTNRLCRCWIWFIVLVVTITFIVMVMIMKVFRKKFV